MVQHEEMIVVNFQEGKSLLRTIRLQLVEDRIWIAGHTVDNFPGSFSKSANSHVKISTGFAGGIVPVESESPFYFRQFDASAPVNSRATS